MAISGTGCTKDLKLFAGGYTREGEKGLYLYDFNHADGSLKLVSEADAGPNPAFFCFSDKDKIIYALNEVREFNGNRGGGITSLKYDVRTRKFEKLNEILVPFGGPCYISISPENDFLFVANYGSGSIAVVKLDKNGIPESIAHSIQYEIKPPDVSHPHMISHNPAGKRVYVTDLGLDRIVVYDFDRNTGKLIQVENGIVNLPDGSGPRHFTFNADGSKMYLINELGSTAMVFDVDETGNLKLLQTLITTRPGFEGKNYCADIHLGKDGKFLYGSNRGENSIVIYRIGEDGLISLAGSVPCGGDWPRNFVIDPAGEFLMVGNQRSDNISVFKIDKNTGIPSGPVTNVNMKAPACLKISQGQ